MFDVDRKPWQRATLLHSHLLAMDLLEDMEKLVGIVGDKHIPSHCSEQASHPPYSLIQTQVNQQVSPTIERVLLLTCYKLGYCIKNPYPLRNCIIPNKATVQTQEQLACILVVPGAPTVTLLGIMQLLNGYGFLLLSHDPWKWGSLDAGKLCISQNPFSSLILTLVMG